MRSKPSFVLWTVLAALLAVSPTLLTSAWAKPKYRVLQYIPGGLFLGVTFDSQGNLFGASAADDGDNCGTIFELMPQPKGKWMVTTVHEFVSGTDGCGPSGNLIFDEAGNIYGTTRVSGPNGYGTVYELTRGSGGWSLNVLFSFDGSDGNNPFGLVMDRSGNLYGLAGGGANYVGIAYELTPGSGGWNESVLYNFGSDEYDASYPTGALILDRAGNLYGTSAHGGKYVYGTVFELERTSGGWEENLLWPFDGRDGGGPQAGVVFDHAGHLYGTTEGGGSNTCDGDSCGVAFKLVRGRAGQWKETVLYGFENPADGFFPSSGLVKDKTGILYGTTALGGNGSCPPDGCGVVHKLAPGAKGRWKYTVLHKFDGGDGSGPLGGLTLDNKGNLYGTAYSVVFEITP